MVAVVTGIFLAPCRASHLKWSKRPLLLAGPVSVPPATHQLLPSLWIVGLCSLPSLHCLHFSLIVRPYHLLFFLCTFLTLSLYSGIDSILIAWATVLVHFSPDPKKMSSSGTCLCYPSYTSFHASPKILCACRRCTTLCSSNIIRLFTHQSHLYIRIHRASRLIGLPRCRLLLHLLLSGNAIRGPLSPGCRFYPQLSKT